MSESIGYPVIKRLYECLYTDPDFFNKLSEDPLSMSEKTGIKEDPEEVLRTAERIKDTKGEENPYYVLYRERLETVNRELMEGLSEAQYEDRRLYAHGRTTSNRMAVSTVRIRLHPNIRYYPVMFELTEGCSQNCPFCALDTKPLSKIFLYTKENSVLWREILGIIKKAVGPAAGMGVCYFATEPLDNPDYEHFISDFRELFGRQPQTTTALCLKDPDRIRRFISGTDKEDMFRGAVRISVRSLEEFYRVLSEYTPEELADIEIVPNNPESASVYSASGRKFGKTQEGCADYSITCICGLKVNMASKTVAFEEAEMPDEEHPTGERIYETVSFEDAASFKKAVEYLLDIYARDAIRDSDLLFFDRCVDVTVTGNEAVLEGDAVRLLMTGNYQFIDVLRMLKEEKLSMDMISERLGLSEFVKNSLLVKLDRIYKKGYLRCIPQRSFDRI